MQITQPKIIGIVDENGIRIWDVQSTLHDGRTNQYVKFAIHEGKHQFL